MRRIGATCGQGMRLRTGLLNPVRSELGCAVASMPHLRGKTYKSERTQRPIDKRFISGLADDGDVPVIHATRDEHDKL